MSNPTTFLELCQRTATECGVSLTGPSAVAGQTGRLGQIVKWVQTAWTDIQTKHNDWKFMVGNFTVNTIEGDGQYAFGDCTDTATSAAIAAFRDWRRNTLKIYLTSAGSGTETSLRFIDYDDWYRRYNTGNQSNSYPGEFTVDNARNLQLAPKPNGIYTVSGEYQKAATDLTADSDMPSLPAEYTMAIVYRAMMKYGRYNGASEVYTDGENNYLRLLREMTRTQRPAIMVGGPLA